MEKDTIKSERRSFDFTQKAAINKLSTIKVGHIRWHDNHGITVFGEDTHTPPVIVTIHREGFYKKFALGGSLGAAESYMAGDWSCSDLVALMTIIINNQDTLLGLERGWSFPKTLSRIIRHFFYRQSKTEAEKNIHYHYDMSNTFFSQFLDDRMIYSSAMFSDHHRTLNEAQQNKLETICNALSLSKEDHCLEIGTGWGGFAVYAAQTRGCKITTITISDAQYDYASAHVQQLGLGHLITVLKKDYRDLTDTYDKLVSIEMIESIGHRQFEQYFEICNQCLKPGGIFLLQAITINDNSYSEYKKDTDFIRTYIFPGGCLPSRRIISDILEKKTQLFIQSCQSFGLDYAKTLASWRTRYEKNKTAITQLGFDDKFHRMFEFYFTYCEAGFASQYIDVVHLTLVKENE